MSERPAATALPDETVDLLVIGSGAAGLAAAIAAAEGGLRVMVVEKEPEFGGTTAWSGGWMWIPGNPLAAAGAAQRLAAVADARAYLQAALGPEAFEVQGDKIEAYLAHGPDMLEFFRTLPSMPLEFEVDTDLPDFRDTGPDNPYPRAVRARSLKASIYDDDLRRLRRPLRLLTIYGVAIEAGRELATVLRAPRWPLKPSAWWRTGALLMPQWLGSCSGRRRFVNGNALVARLLRAARTFGSDLTMHAGWEATVLKKNAAGRVDGALVRSGDRERLIGARHVVLAGGGFPHDARRWGELSPRPGFTHFSAAPRSNDGKGLRLGEAVGGVVGPTAAAPAVWSPVSLVPQRDGSLGVYPHLIERDKPGVIAVDRQGQRFCNEGIGYHDFVETWSAATARDKGLEAWLVCDRTFLRHYGMGAQKPPSWWFRLDLRRFKASGYLIEAPSIEALARACGIEPGALGETVDAYNGPARRKGLDPAFGKGTSPFDKAQGDPLLGRCRHVAPIERAPFYAVRLYPGNLGTFAGLDTDKYGRVLDAASRPIPGLHACGNDMASPMGGFYPASGLTLGAAMTFGWLVGRRAALALGA